MMRGVGLQDSHVELDNFEKLGSSENVAFQIP